MVCKNCFQEDNEMFKYNCNVFKDRHNLVLYLINIVMNIKEIWMDFCKCIGEEICLVCQANMFYKKYEHTIYRNCLNLNFLAKVRENVCGNLNKLLTLNNHFVCEVINRKYQYKHEDWFTGKQLFFDLELCLTKWEEKQISNILSNNCQVILESLNLFVEKNADKQ